VVEVGVQPTKNATKYAKIRFDPNYIIGVEEIDLGGAKGQYNVASFPGWSLKKVRAGQSDTADVQRRDGRKVKPFNFSGSLRTLPELHRALCHIISSRTQLTMPTPAAALKLGKDPQGVIDISGFGQPTYTRQTYRFGEFALYTESCLFRSASGQFTTYETLSLTKKKVSLLQNFFYPDFFLLLLLLFFKLLHAYLFPTVGEGGENQQSDGQPLLHPPRASQEPGQPPDGT
jgi:hypothetical protein